MEKLKDYGLIEIAEEVGAYIFGDNNVPFIPYQPDGNWEAFLPRYETQRDRFETYCCTVFGTLNAIETLHKRLYGTEPNYSESFTAILSGLTGTGGTDPQTPCESIRHDGVITQELMPMTNTIEEFFDKGKITGSLLAKGQNWLYNYDFKHDWVWKGTRPDNYIELLKQALKTSPLGVSVSAWNEVDGVYVSTGNVNNHWCLLYNIDDEGYPWIFDSYDHSKKKLAKDHNIRRAKRIYISNKKEKVKSLMEKVIELLQQLLLLKKKQK